LDVLYHNDTWKADTTSPDFDSTLLEARLKQLDQARINCDVPQMLYLVRTALSRDLGGMGNLRLYKHSFVGTKQIIERYINSAVATIRALVRISGQGNGLDGGLEIKDVLEQVVYARQAFGRSALLLSGGATFGMNHVGVLKALFEAKMLPRIISGASAGSIISAVLCTRTDEEIPGVLKNFPYGDLAVFEEDGNEDGLLQRIGRFLTQGAWVDIKHLIRVMQALLGDMTFQEAYNRTRRILNICVSSASVYELPRLLNYITSPNVMIWSAVTASCSVPLLFSAAHLLVKNPATGEHSQWNPTPQRWIDGSVDNDLPMTRLAEMFNVNHFIVSQVNPHVIPFLAKDDATIAEAALAEETGPGWLYTVANLAKGEALHRLHVLAEMGIFPNLVTKCQSILSQKYSGDITILPEISYADFPRMLKNPNSEFMERTCLAGERATWPRLSRIMNHCAVELELDSAVQALRAKVVFSPSQVDLRRMTTGRIDAMSDSHSGRVNRRRRVSGSNLKTFGTDQDSDDTEASSMRMRPPLRTSSSHWTVPRRHLQHTPKLSSPTTVETKKSPKHKFLNLPALNIPPVPDLSSGTETVQTEHSSDADIDTHTDDSSPEPENDPFSGGSFEPSQSSLFFASQPATPWREGTLNPFGVGVVLSPLLSRKSLNDGKAAEKTSATAPSSPELIYKRLFHPPRTAID
jgi:TAG lipase/steryl ester hydrolase/phospholipase A2/LPA acyltransferase